MRLKITTKGFQIPTQLYKHLDFHLQKISQRLPHLKYDLSSFSIIIRKTAHKYYIKRHYHHAYTNYSDRKGALALFEGSMNLQLPKKPLIVTFKGQTINECIDSGVDRLKKELQKQDPILNLLTSHSYAHLKRQLNPSTKEFIQSKS